MHARESYAAVHRRCFCQFEMSALKRIIRRKYVDKVPTIELLRRASSAEERELVSIVALLDVSEEDLNGSLGHLVRPGCDLVACRSHVKQWLEAMLAAESEAGFAK